MKSSLFRIGLYLIAGLFVSSCSKEEDNVAVQNEQIEIKLTNSITAPTRVSSLEEQATAINKDQVIGVTILNASAPHNNTRWTSDGFKNLINQGKPIYYQSGNTAEIYAYHPYNNLWSDVLNQNYTFTVGDDQSTVKGYADSDLLWATTTATSENTEATLVFHHMLSKVNVILDSEDDSDISTADISLINVEKSVKFKKGELTVAESNKGFVIAGKGTKQASAIIVPQTINEGESLVLVTLGGKNYTYKTTACKTLEPGKLYIYKLKLNLQKELEMDDMEVLPWDAEEDNIGNLSGGEGTEVTPDGTNRNYLSFTAQEDNCEIKYINKGGNNPNLMYSENKIIWEKWDADHTLNLSQGKVIYLKGTNPDGFSHYNGPEEEDRHSQFSTKGKLSVNGNIMSLLYGDDFGGNLTIPNSSGCFYYLFQNATITSAPELPATTLTRYCYSHMFAGCTGLEEAPALPASEMQQHCYSYMFYNCTSLAEAPELQSMSLAENCYHSMFNECTDLVKGPELPATTLASYCYQNMFYKCSSLTEAPELPATTIVQGCYYGMFHLCSSLSSVKAAFMNTPQDAFTKWLNGTAESGTFFKKANASWSQENAEIPSGWTIKTY